MSLPITNELKTISWKSGKDGERKQNKKSNVNQWQTETKTLQTMRIKWKKTETNGGTERGKNVEDFDG